jgi:invasion protein IalB
VLLGLVAIFVAGGFSAAALRRMLAPPQASQTVAAYRDWRLTCVPARPPAPACALTQDIVLNRSGQTIVRLAMGSDRTRGQLVVTVPHDVLLPAGLGFAIGGNKALAARYATCDQIGCMALIPIDASVRDAITQNDAGQIVFVGLDNKPVTVAYSLRGFVEGRSAFESKLAEQNSWWGFLVR